MEPIIVPTNCGKTKEVFAYALDNVISSEWCTNWIQRSLPLLQYITQAKHVVNEESIPIDLINPRKYRLALLNDEAFTTHLWNQLLPRISEPLTIFMKREGLDDTACIGLNPPLRVLHYSSTHQDRFEPHYDQTIVNGDDWSLITVLLYLNDDFSLGNTWFLNPENIEKDEKGRFHTGVSIQPKMGRVLLFEHDLFHSGAQVEHGSKYIMRTEIMFKKKKVDIPTAPTMNTSRTMEELLQNLQLEHTKSTIEEVIGLSCTETTIDSMKSIGIDLLSALFTETSITTIEQQQLLDAIFQP